MAVSVLSPFLIVPSVGLWYAIVAFPGHTHLLIVAFPGHTHLLFVQEVYMHRVFGQKPAPSEFRQMEAAYKRLVYPGVASQCV